MGAAVDKPLKEPKKKSFIQEPIIKNYYTHKNSQNMENPIIQNDSNENSIYSTLNHVENAVQNGLERQQLEEAADLMDKISKGVIENIEATVQTVQREVIVTTPLPVSDCRICNEELADLVASDGKGPPTSNMLNDVGLIKINEIPPPQLDPSSIVIPPEDPVRKEVILEEVNQVQEQPLHPSSRNISSLHDLIYADCVTFPPELTATLPGAVNTVEITEPSSTHFTIIEITSPESVPKNDDTQSFTHSDKDDSLFIANEDKIRVIRSSSTAKQDMTKEDVEMPKNDHNAKKKKPRNNSKNYLLTHTTDKIIYSTLFGFTVKMLARHGDTMNEEDLIKLLNKNMKRLYNINGKQYFNRDDPIPLIKGMLLTEIDTFVKIKKNGNIKYYLNRAEAKNKIKRVKAIIRNKKIELKQSKLQNGDVNKNERVEYRSIKRKKVSTYIESEVGQTKMVDIDDVVVVVPEKEDHNRQNAIIIN